MPRATNLPGVTGTTHHCPGAKASEYVKMGNCAGKAQYGYCTTHQVPCEVPDCKWNRLKHEECRGCKQRREAAERKAAELRRVQREKEVYELHFANKGRKK
ncbi:hypothetical protein MMC28_005412 [Mycoblastus sanguinarius]|nr:hypothetical protein [Mycoblastus sanguinarius]